MDNYYLTYNNAAKEKLTTWDMISRNEAIKDLLPHVIIYGKYGAGVENMAKSYSKIINQSDFLKFKGECFLNLKFKFSNELLEVHRMFFESPLRFARQSKRNDFLGVFLIDLSEWEDVKILNNPVFDHFLQYLSENKDGLMKFCIWMPPTLQGSYLDMEVQSVLPMAEQIELRLPRAEECVHYVKLRLDEKGIFLDRNAKKELLNGFEQLALEEKFAGFETINTVTQTLLYRLAGNGILELCPSRECIRDVMIMFLKKNEQTNEKRPIGFA